MSAQRDLRFHAQADWLRCMYLISVENTPLISVEGDVARPVVLPLRRA